MKLLELSTQGLRVPDGTYSLRDPRGVPLDVVLVTGAPASGKTSFLLAIAAIKEAFGPYGSPPDLRRLLRAGSTGGRLAATWLLSEADANRAKLSAREQHTAIEWGPEGESRTGETSLRHALTPLPTLPGVGKFELFPDTRRLLADRWRPPSPPLSAAIEEGRRLAADPEKYLALRRVLHDLAVWQSSRIATVLETRGIALRQDVPDVFAPYKEAVVRLLPELRLASVEAREGAAALSFARRDGRAVALGELSASEEQAVLFALAFAWLGLEHSVVLVDTPELYQHPAHHVRFFRAITELGRDNQIIAATTSAELLREAASHQVIRLGA